MDYDSEEEDGDDDGEEKEDLGEEEEPAPINSQEEAQAKSMEVTVKDKKKRKGRQEGGSQMRVNSVLESNPAIERYCYDDQQELWCEVGSASTTSLQLRSVTPRFTHISLFTARPGFTSEQGALRPDLSPISVGAKRHHHGNQRPDSLPAE